MGGLGGWAGKCNEPTKDAQGIERGVNNRKHILLNVIHNYGLPHSVSSKSRHPVSIPHCRMAISVSPANVRQHATWRSMPRITRDPMCVPVPPGDVWFYQYSYTSACGAHQSPVTSSNGTMFGGVGRQRKSRTRPHKSPNPPARCAGRKAACSLPLLGKSESAWSKSMSTTLLEGPIGLRHRNILFY